MRTCLILSLLALLIVAVSVPDADARRFGGGASFGAHRMMPSSPGGFSRPGMAGPMRTPYGTQRGSARTGLMGMLGGLAMGGLLGAMFFGGSFNGINLLDILVIGGVVFLLFRFLGRNARSATAAYAGGMHAGSHDFGSGTAQVTVLRPKIDEKHFLHAARDIFMRMQTAWDAKDMDDIRRFCTPEVAERIEADMRTGGNNKTEVTTLDAQIADAWIESDLEWVAVNFAALMREEELDARGGVSNRSESEVHETWIFRHDPAADDPTWFLAGIQQYN